MKNILLLERREVRKISRYLGVGVLAFCVEFISFIAMGILFNEHISLLAQQSTSFLAGLIISFVGSRVLTFKSSQGSYRYGPGKQAAAYLTVAAINLLMTNIIIHYLVDLGFNAIVAKVGVMFLVVTWNYMVFSRFIFGSSRKA